ncbi:MAG: LamG domain-containing protein, partial [Paramuribaculum sp.]|nr:LamG domain-containing protein [Paramuribaculum sp.]
MRKVLLLLCAIMMMPALASADNMAVRKTKASSYPNQQPSEARLNIPYESIGYGSLSTVDPKGMAGTESYTYAMWVKVTEIVATNNDNSKNGGVLASFATLEHNNYNGNWAMTVTPTGECSIVGHGANNHGAGVGFAGNVSKTLPINEWVYVAFVVDNTNLKAYIYFNDEVAYEATLSGAMYYPWADGWFQAGAFGVSCDIDEVQMYNAPLTAAQVAIAKDNPRSISSLKSLYTFDEVAEGTTGTFNNVLDNGLNAKALFQTTTHRISSSDGGMVEWGKDAGRTVETAASLVESSRVVAPVEVTVNVADIENGSL